MRCGLQERQGNITKEFRGKSRPGRSLCAVVLSRGAQMKVVYQLDTFRPPVT